TGFMTGRTWSRFGVTAPQNERALPFDTVTITRALKEAGYETCLTGKWHLGSKPEWGPNHFGFDHSYGSLAGGVGPWNHFYKKGPYSTTWHRDETLITEEGHVTDLIAKEATTWIAGRGDKPFFLYVPFTAVHLPVKEPEPFLDKVPSAITGDVPRHYAACILHLDDAVGRIVAAVEQAGKADRTVIVFTSDNGGSTAENNDTKYPEDDYPSGRLTGNNLPLRGQKGDPYEGGTRVPTVIRWPGTLKPGTVCDTPLHITDWMPTFCALAGHTPAGDLKWDGQNVWGAITGESALPERSLYSVAPSFRAQILRRGDWKLIVHAGGKDPKTKADRPGKSELFLLSADPNETTDLAGTEPAKLAEMKGWLDEAMQADRDAVVPRGE
ncbi:MAG: sulfatase-like hydrolase/transferase, partial [Verrucomicrobiae bacterium]|nr:sulfatase-like hydrolase/transferase [Verrucomicrobiae bacterium]